MKIYAFLISCFWVQLPLSAQYINISGIVKDKLTNENLPSASIFVKNSGVGIFTNQEGAFELSVPQELINDTLVFSYIGYKNRYLLLSKSVANVVISLEYEARELAVVSVVADTSYKIVQKALSLIRKNYPHKAHYQAAFFRELSMNDDRYVRIIEAAVAIRDKSYLSVSENRKLKIIAIRKSEDYIEKSLVSRLVDKLYGDENRNTLVKTLNFADFIRTYNYKQFLIEGHWKNDFSQNYDFKLREVTLYNNEKVYIIDFFFPANRKRNDILGEIVINAADFGILKLGYKFGDSVDKMKTKSKFWKPAFNTFYYEYIAYYRKVDDRYYLSKVSGVFPINFSGLKNGDTAGFQFYYTDLVINDIFLKRRDFERIKNRDKLDRSLSLYDSDFKYDATFWKNYNKTIIDGSIKKAKQDLKNAEIENE